MERNEQIKDYKRKEIFDIEKVYSNFYGYVYTITVNTVKKYLQEEDIEEIISDTFFVLWKNRNKLDEDRKIKPYIAGITKKLIQEKMRKNKVYRDISVYENKIESMEKIDFIQEEREEILLLKQVMGKLKKQDIEIVKLYYYQAMKIKEIAKVFNLSEFTVKQRLYRIRKRIKKEIEKKGGYRDEK